MLKEFVVCEEIIKSEHLGCDYSFYSIRINTDCNSARFNILTSFDTYEEAEDYVDFLRHPEDYFNLDDD